MSLRIIKGTKAPIFKFYVQNPDCSWVGKTTRKVVILYGMDCCFDLQIPFYGFTKGKPEQNSVRISPEFRSLSCKRHTEFLRMEILGSTALKNEF